MGILARITDGIKGNRSTSSSKSNIGSTDGGHSIDKNRILEPTDPTVINPNNPGNWESVRTAPIVESPRYFTKPEANVLKKIATEKTEGARQSQRAYKSLGKIEKADATVHKAHRKYQGVVSENELTKLRSNARLGRKLHAQRPEYVRMSNGLERAEQSAQTRIDELKAKAKGAY
jgi:hypothetical protein